MERNNFRPRPFSGERGESALKSSPSLKRKILTFSKALVLAAGVAGCSQHISIGPSNTEKTSDAGSYSEKTSTELKPEGGECSIEDFHNRKILLLMADFIKKNIDPKCAEGLKEVTKGIDKDHPLYEAVYCLSKVHITFNEHAVKRLNNPLSTLNRASAISLISGIITSHFGKSIYEDKNFKAFKDVRHGSWYNDVVAFMYKNGILNDSDADQDGNFKPDINVCLADVNVWLNRICNNFQCE